MNGRSAPPSPWREPCRVTCHPATVWEAWPMSLWVRWWLLCGSDDRATLLPSYGRCGARAAGLPDSGGHTHPHLRMRGPAKLVSRGRLVGNCHGSRRTGTPCPPPTPPDPPLPSLAAESCLSPWRLRGGWKSWCAMQTRWWCGMLRELSRTCRQLEDSAPAFPCVAFLPLADSEQPGHPFLASHPPPLVYPPLLRLPPLAHLPPSPRLP